MASSYDPSYNGREQSLIKHVILDKYLERFARIVGKRYSEILYVDGFSGPWNVQSEDLKDASFSIALGQLRKARETVRSAFKHDLRITCIFLEKEPGPFARLKKFADSQSDAKVIALNQDFESAIPELVRIAKNSGDGTFPFIFIDPTGWTGFSMDVIAPLLRLNPCEVLINFMTEFISRFAEDERPEIDDGFKRLFGDSTFREKCKDLEGKSREDALIFEYAERVSRTGNFAHVPITLIPHPTNDRTHFHLVYATRNLMGVEVFKAAERHALNLAGEVRADAKRRKREAKTNQSEFFDGAELPETNYLEEQSSHYSKLARDKVHDFLRKKIEVSYDDVYAVAMRFPLVQAPALRTWISEIADLTHLGDGHKVPKLNLGHRVKIRTITA
jgi:three-Cys-motif partner protein